MPGKNPCSTCNGKDKIIVRDARDRKTGYAPRPTCGSKDYV